jgi:hypothetical protein
MANAPLSDQPTIAVSMRCLKCGGGGTEPDRTVSDGRTRFTESGGVCPKCAGDGKVEERVTLTQLAELLANPADAERRLFGSFVP